MAEKRMFNQKIVTADQFIELPLSAQALYFHLAMWADDDGFVNNVKGLIRTTGTEKADLMTLESAGYIMGFESGVFVILHWNMHNHISAKIYKPTIFKEEKEQLLSYDTVYSRTLPKPMKKKTLKADVEESNEKSYVPDRLVQSSVD